jgi:uncharacterized membrane protein YuzA (DUF378 family)
MESEAILRIILLIVVLGIVHWGLVPMALENLVARRRVIGGRKGPWALAILFITCLGSLLYLLIHPETQDQPY